MRYETWESLLERAARSRNEQHVTKEAFVASNPRPPRQHTGDGLLFGAIGGGAVALVLLLGHHALRIQDASTTAGVVVLGLVIAGTIGGTFAESIWIRRGTPKTKKNEEKSAPDRLAPQHQRVLDLFEHEVATAYAFLGSTPRKAALVEQIRTEVVDRLRDDVTASIRTIENDKEGHGASEDVVLHAFEVLDRLQQATVTLRSEYHTSPHKSSRADFTKLLTT